MATSRDNSLGYRTHVVSTVRPVIESRRIVVYNKYKFSNIPEYRRISIYNIDEVYNLVRNHVFSDGNIYCAFLNKNETDDSFDYRYADNRGLEGFNVIIYLSNFDNSPIGYTEFFRTQGKERNVKIKIALETTVLGGVELKLINSLEPVRSSSSQQRIFTGDELWDFTSSDKIYSSLSSMTPISRYTSHLTSFNGYKSTRNIYQTNFLVRQDNDNIVLEKLGVTKDIEINPFNNHFTNYQISYYNNNLALYSWRNIDNEFQYSITSLTERNIFGRQIYYTVSNNATSTVDRNLDVDYFAGPYIICKDGTILDTLNNNSRVLGTGLAGKTSFIDPLDPESKIYSYYSLSQGNIFQTIPEISGVYLDIRDYIRRYTINVVRKIGAWFLLRQTNRLGSFYILVNQNSLYYLTDEDYSRLLIINDSVFMLKEDNYYIIYFLSEGEYKTERYRAFEQGITLTISDVLDVNFCSTNTSIEEIEQNTSFTEDEKNRLIKFKREDEKYLNYFIQNKISRVFKSFPIHDTVLNLFRKNYYGEDNTIPDIIGCCDGLLFYIKDNTLLYI